MRAYLSSPIQISSTLESLTDMELAIYCNEEIIAINQDCAFNTPTILSRVKEGERYFDTFEKELEDGTFAYAFFNLGSVDESVKLAPNEVSPVKKRSSRIGSNRDVPPPKPPRTPK